MAVNSTDLHKFVTMSKDIEQNLPPLIDQFIKKFKQPLEMIKDLYIMNVIPRNILIPKIVVIGDEQVGKSSLISNLIGIEFPTCVQVPLLFKYVHDSSPNPNMHLHYQCDDYSLDREILQDKIHNEFSDLLKEVPEDMKNSNGFLILTIRHQEISDLTIIDLPGKKSYAANHEKKELSEALKGYISQHIRDEECVYLQVISAEKDLNICLSAKILKELDVPSKRIVKVITNIECATRDNHIIFTRKKVDPPFGYAFVQNIRDCKISQDTFFDHLPKIVKKCFGLNWVATHVSNGILSVLFRPLSLIREKVDDELKETLNRVNQSKRKFNNVGEAFPTILSIIAATQVTLHEMFNSQVYGGYIGKHDIHAPEKLIERLKTFYLEVKEMKDDKKQPFLIAEMDLLQENHFSCPSTLISSIVFNNLLMKHIQYVSRVVNDLIGKIWEYIEWVVLEVLGEATKEFKQLHVYLEISAMEMIQTMKINFQEQVRDMFEMEKLILHTSDPEFIAKWTKYKSQDLEAVLDFKKEFVKIEGLGEIKIDHLNVFEKKDLKTAFDAKMLLVAYWETISIRCVDNFTLRLVSLIKKMVTGGMVSMMAENCMKTGEKEKKLPEEAFDECNCEIEKQNLEYLSDVKEQIKKLHQESMIYRR